ncbi:FAD binding domain-containing protein [Rutstroemia sp. NJR-2017a WRK4]|nr:FAD binding domain-containing protein [Rutstroemia sp. NJR-2017a WRK4]
MAETQLRKDPVIIIGAGCTGLSIAHGLRKAGIEAIVCEKHAAISSPGQRDWNMGLHWGMPVLKSLLPESLHPELQSCQVDPHTPTKALDTLSFLNGATGDVLNAPQIPYFYRLRRSKVRTLLAKGLDIRWNKRLQDVIYDHDAKGVTCVFEDGQHIRGRLVIGADGARSVVRKLLLGPGKAENTRLPYAASFVQARYTREQALFLRSFHPLYLASPHPNNLFAFFGLQDAPDPKKPETWTFFFYISWHSSAQDEEAKTFDNKARLRQVRELAKDYTEPWKSAFEWLPEDQPVWYSGLAVWDPSEEGHGWDNMNGRVTLAGDAAHPMTYQRGQGLNHAIADAGKIVALLKSETLDQASAIAQYEEEMKARAGEEVRLSVMNTTMLHDWTKVLESPVMRAGLNKTMQ